MAGSKGSTDQEKRAYKRYQAEGRYGKNKMKKLQRHLKEYPNDSCAKAALKTIKLYSRKAPKTNQWTRDSIESQVLFIAAAVGVKKKGSPKGGDVRKLREEAVAEINKHLNLSTKNQKDGSPALKQREYKSDFFRVEKRARYK